MLKVSLLGRFEVQKDRALLSIPSRPAQSLLAYLLLTLGTDHRREKLAGLLWPDSSEENARNNLRTALWRLRKVLGSDAHKRPYLLADDLSITFNHQSDYWLDTSVLECGASPQATTEDLHRFLSHYRGELLPGFYEDWVVLERVRLQAVFEQEVERLLDHLIAERRWAEVLDWGERWIAFGETPEPAYRALMSAHSELGDVSKVAAVYQRCVEALRRDLGVEPSPETTVLYQEIKESGSEQKSATARLTNVPNPLTSFIGRQREIQEIKDILARRRLVTLTGSGGSGKTRLAIQVASDLVDDFQDGVWWVELAALTDQGLVPQAVAKALGVREVPTQPLSETLAGYLQTKKLLLVMDNLEHLVVGCAELADHLLSACPSLKILGTSREALGLTGEHVWQVPTLTLPDAHQLPLPQLLGRYEGIQLFVERAIAVKSDFELTRQNAFAVAQVCRRLDGIPLAIELSAVRVKVLSPQEIAVHLNDLFSLLTSGSRTALPRHQTLRAAMEWSHDLLTEGERILFRRLSVFEGGFTLEAAEAICAGEGVRRDEILNLLSRLVDKSLVVAETGEGHITRYLLLDTIRQYAHGKLLDSDRSDRLYDLHLDFFMKFAEDVEPHLQGAEAVGWLDRLQNDWYNFRSAIRWSLKSDRGERGLRIATALMFFAYYLGNLREFHQILLELLNSQGTGKRTTALGKGLFVAAVAGVELGNFKDSRPLYEESIAILREAGQEGRGLLETVLAFFANALVWREPSTAARYAQEAVHLCRESGNRDGLVSALIRLGEAHSWMNDGASARLVLEESAMIAQEIGNQFFYLVAIIDLGVAYLFVGDLETARGYLEKANPTLVKAYKIGGVLNTYLGEIARIQGRQAEAETLLKEAVVFLRETGDKRASAQALVFLGRLELDRANLVVAEECFSQALSMAREANAWTYIPFSLESSAYLFLGLNQPQRAIRLLGAAEACREKLGTPLRPMELNEYDPYLATAHAQLEEATFNATWAEGRAMTMGQAIEYALEKRSSV